MPGTGDRRPTGSPHQHWTSCRIRALRPAVAVSRWNRSWRWR